MPFQVALLDTAPPPLYQRIAAKALHLHELGLGRAAIARRVNASGRTVARAITWLRRMRRSATSPGTR
jgi:hypothetical protein